MAKKLTSPTRALNKAIHLIALIAREVT